MKVVVHDEKEDKREWRKEKGKEKIDI